MAMLLSLFFVILANAQKYACKSSNDIAMQERKTGKYQTSKST
jgi:hypothetical protein